MLEVILGWTIKNKKEVLRYRISVKSVQGTIR